MPEEYNLKSDQPLLDMMANIIPMAIWVVLLALFVVTNALFFGLGFDLITVVQYALIVVPLVLMVYLTWETGKRI